MRPCASTSVAALGSAVPYVVDGGLQSSTSGAVFLFVRCPGARGSNPVSPSSTKTEYAASTEAAKGAIWLRQLMHDLTQDMPQPTSRLLDNQLLANPVHNSNTKHI